MTYLPGNTLYSYNYPTHWWSWMICGLLFSVFGYIFYHKIWKYQVKISETKSQKNENYKICQFFNIFQKINITNKANSKTKQFSTIDMSTFYAMQTTKYASFQNNNLYINNHSDSTNDSDESQEDDDLIYQFNHINNIS